ncbi:MULTISPECIES: transposase [Paraburkholderia]|uniref:transposase n=1 Tax=Paraburkholderia TaxID=1822464 RepID=UPI003898DD7C
MRRRRKTHLLCVTLPRWRIRLRSTRTDIAFEPLSDEDWNRLVHLFPINNARRYGRYPRNPRDVLNAILWVLTQNERWHHLPAGMPPAQTCYIKYLQWRRLGIVARIAETLEIHLE